MIGQRVSDADYVRIALGDDDHRWELHDGRVREKPGADAVHNEGATWLLYALFAQLDRPHFNVRTNSARVRYPGGYFYVPDVVAIPEPLTRPLRGRPDLLETYDAPLPLVVEIWSAATPDYDEFAKIALSRQRGDQEIWFLDPYKRDLTRWLRRPDGGYDEERQRGGIVRPAFLPDVAIDLDDLFAD